MKRMGRRELVHPVHLQHNFFVIQKTLSGPRRVILENRSDDVLSWQSRSNGGPAKVREVHLEQRLGSAIRGAPVEVVVLSAALLLTNAAADLVV